MMSDPARDAIESFERYLHAFNERDVDGMLAEMHFPHMRLVDDDFQRWETSEGMAALEENVTRALKAEGWHTSKAISIEPVQVGPAKVHLPIECLASGKTGRSTTHSTRSGYLPELTGDGASDSVLRSLKTQLDLPGLTIWLRGEND